MSTHRPPTHKPATRFSPKHEPASVRLCKPAVHKRAELCSIFVFVSVGLGTMWTLLALGISPDLAFGGGVAMREVLAQLFSDLMR